MARQGSGRGTTVQVVQDATLERVAASAISKVGPLVPPWLCGIAAWAAGWVAHHAWGDGPGLPWATVGLTIGAGAVTGMTWVAAHHRRWLGRAHATVSAAAAGGWVTAAAITGPGGPVVGDLWLLGAPALALTWNVRHVIRGADPDDDTAGGDGLRALFDKAKAAAGLGNATARTTQADAHKVVGRLQLPPGEQTAADVLKRLAHLESAMRLPPGAATVTADTDRADRAHLTISDPRVMRAPIPWPGPSRPGASIADPLRPGVWQDLDDVAYTLLGHHLQIMGMSGAGKSIGGCWNVLAEVITRPDVAVFGFDLTKGTQTLGPLRAALHRFETTQAGVKRLFGQLAASVKERTDYLATQGLTKWAPGCGIAYWLVWFEEVPDIVNVLDGEKFTAFVKAARSAGIGLVLSLQRSDWSQMPTIVRGQLAKMCFGVENSGDADFGLTEAQTKAGARPEQWGAKQPGMTYLDAPGMDPARIAMPMRTYAWGEDAQAAQTMTAHAAAWPATRVPADPFLERIAPMPTSSSPTSSSPTSTAAGGAGTVIDGEVLATTPHRRPWTPPQAHHNGRDETDDRDDMDDERDDMDDERELVGDPWGDYVHTPDPDPDLTAGPDDPIDPPETPWTFTPPAGQVPLEQARAVLLHRIQDLAADGRTDFTAADLRPVRDTVGRSRQWITKELKTLATDGIVSEFDETIPGYRILRPLPDAA